MSVASTNIFNLLIDDAQDSEVQVPVVKPAKKETKPAPKTGNRQVAGGDNKSRNINNNNNNNNSRSTYKQDGARGGRSGAPRDGDRAPRGPRFDREKNDGPRPYQGDRHYRPRGGRHEGLDRQSGTGIVDSEKKENQAWGEPITSEIEGEKIAQDEINWDTGNTKNEDKEPAWNPNPDWNDIKLDDTSSVSQPTPVEPEQAVKTFDDYLAEKAAKSLKVSLPQARAANAGIDDSQWKNTQVYVTREEEDFINLGSESSSKNKTKARKEGKVLITDIDVRFNTPAREQSRGGFRGGFRGGRGRGGRGGHNPRRGGATVNVDDTDSFPTLGSK
jgi:hypothetical protein